MLGAAAARCSELHKNYVRRCNPDGTTARIALHTGAIPHQQPGNATLSAHLNFAVVRPDERGLVQVALRASRSAKTGARAPRFSARSRRRHGRGGRSGRRRLIAVKLPQARTSASPAALRMTTEVV